VLGLVLESRELKRAAFLDSVERAERCTSATQRRIAALVTDGATRTQYLEGGRPA
jgi:hypothetical protein